MGISLSKLAVGCRWLALVLSWAWHWHAAYIIPLQLNYNNNWLDFNDIYDVGYRSYTISLLSNSFHHTDNENAKECTDVSFIHFYEITVKYIATKLKNNIVCTSRQHYCLWFINIYRFPSLSGSGRGAEILD